jgi:hypothetical protein
MVNPSPNVIDIDINNLREDVGEGSSLGELLTSQTQLNSAVSCNLGDGHISYTQKGKFGAQESNTPKQPNLTQFNSEETLVAYVEYEGG